jgi:maltose O-acetyltransferase
MLRKIIKRFLLGNKYNSDTYIKHLKHCGIEIGKGTRIFDPGTTLLDTQNPHMLTIGDNVRITKGVIILTHDYSWSVLATCGGTVYGGISKTTIGNNVFIGMNSIVLRGSTIEDNVVIGAGSVVHGRVERDSVYAGNPAKKISTLQDYERRMKDRQEEEVRNYISCYIKRFGSIPSKEKLQEYFFSFEDRECNLPEEILELVKRTGAEGKIKKKFKATEPIWQGYEALLKSVCKDIP